MLQAEELSSCRPEGLWKATWYNILVSEATAERPERESQIHHLLESYLTNVHCNVPPQ